MPAMADDRQAPPAPPPAPNRREARLGRALRENLRRRKTQARAREQLAADPPGEPGDDDNRPA